MRALAFAAGPILVLALGAGIVLRLDRIELLGFLIDPTVLDAVFVINLVVLLYRLVAIVDAYRVADYLNAAAASGDGRAGRGRAAAATPLSIAGLLAIVLVMAGSHVVVARYDVLAQDFLDSGCIFLERPDQGMRSRRGDGAGQPAADPDRGRHDRADRDARTGQHARRVRRCPRCRSRRGTARNASTSC